MRYKRSIIQATSLKLLLFIFFTQINSHPFARVLGFTAGPTDVTAALPVYTSEHAVLASILHFPQMEIFINYLS